MSSKKEIKRQQEPCSKPAALWVHEVLEPDQFSKAKYRLGRQPLSRGTIILLWGLRVYVFLMVLLVALQTWNAFHTAR